MLPLQSKKVTIHKSHRKSLSLLDQTQATLTFAMRMKYMSVPSFYWGISDQQLYLFPDFRVCQHLLGFAQSVLCTPIVLLFPSVLLDCRASGWKAGQPRLKLEMVLTMLRWAWEDPDYTWVWTVLWGQGCVSVYSLWNVFSLTSPQEGTTKIGRLDSDQEQDIGR